MKQNQKHSHLSIYQPQQPICPNAADNNYFAHKALDVMTAIVSCIGFVCAMLFLFTMA